MSWEEAQKAGLKREFWEKKKKAADKFADTWENKLGGKKSKLVQALKKGWNKKKHYAPKIKAHKGVKGLSLLSGLGEPISAIIGTSVAAAATIIATVASLLKKNGANDMPPGDEEYAEDKVETVTNAAQDLAENAQDIADNVSGLGALGLHDAVEPAFEEVGDLGKKTKAERQAAKAARKQKRQQKKEGRKTKKATAKATRKAKKAEKGGASVDISDMAQKAGGAVSAANQLYKNTTGKDLIPGGVDAFVEKADDFFTPDEQAAIIANDTKVKNNFSEAGMGTVGTVLLVGAALGGGYMLLNASGKSKPKASGTSGLSGHKKQQNFKTLELK